MPKRIQRKRTKGWRMPPNTVNVCRSGRGTGKYGNPFRIGDYAMLGDPDPRRAGPFRMSYCITSAEHADSRYTHVKDAETAVALYRRYRERHPFTEKEKAELRGRDVACFCSEDSPHCHGDVIIELVNR